MKQLLVLFFLLCSVSIWAQDVIVKKDGSTVICRVVEVNTTEIVYKKWSDLNGSNYIMDRSLASAINYESGKRETLGEVQNQYQPHNQNDGVQQYNDRALLALDIARGKPKKKAKRCKTAAWIGAGVFGLIGVGFIASNTESNEEATAGGILLGCGAVWTTSFLLAAKHYNKQAEMFHSQSLIHQSFQFANGSNLSAGLDLLKDNTSHNQTLGIGLRYNF